MAHSSFEEIGEFTPYFEEKSLFFRNYENFQVSGHPI